MKIMPFVTLCTDDARMPWIPPGFYMPTSMYNVIIVYTDPVFFSIFQGVNYDVASVLQFI